MICENETCSRPWPPGQLRCPACGGVDFVHETRAPREPAPQEDVSASAAAVIEGGGYRCTLAAGEECLLGRDDDSPLAHYFRLYPNVSALHVTVRVEDGQLFLVDHGSLNGTWREGTRLDPGREHRLALPAQLRLASNCFVTVSPR